MQYRNLWQEEVVRAYNYTYRNRQYPRIIKCIRCKSYTYRYLDSIDCPICSSQNINRL